MKKRIRKGSFSDLSAISFDGLSNMMEEDIL